MEARINCLTRRYNWEKRDERDSNEKEKERKRIREKKKNKRNTRKEKKGRKLLYPPRIFRAIQLLAKERTGPTIPREEYLWVFKG